MAHIIDGFTLVNQGVGSQTFPLHGGLYALYATASWGGGNLALNIRAPNGTTYIPVTAALTEDGYSTISLPRGSYEFVVTTSTGVYAEIVGIQS